MFLDLAGLQAVNVTGGHRTSDEVLREVARRLQLAVRPSDSIGRPGGDEYAVLWGNAVLARAQAVAARLGEEVHHPVLVGGTTVHVTVTVTVSIGIAVHVPLLVAVLPGP